MTNYARLSTPPFPHTALHYTNNTAWKYVTDKRIKEILRVLGFKEPAVVEASFLVRVSRFCVCSFVCLYLEV